MSDRPSDERLAEIREVWATGPEILPEIHRAIRDLLGEVDALRAEVRAGLAREHALREALEVSEWALDGLLPLVRELCEDAERVYEPEKGWPPHIESARDLGDYEQALADARAALAASRPPGETKESA